MPPRLHQWVLNVTQPPTWALRLYRISHAFYLHGHPVLAEYCHMLGYVFTSTDISPRAEIGRNVTIRHGLGLVVGDTAVIGDGCVLRHGVSLGRRGEDRTPEGRAHPLLGRNVELGAHALLIGPITVGD